MTFNAWFAQEIEKRAASLCQEWLDQLVGLLPVEAREVFPTRDLLDHVPTILKGLGEDLADPEGRDVVTASAVTEKARELGVLRFGQDASVHQILREYDLLAQVLEGFLDACVETREPAPTPKEVSFAAQRIHRAMRVLMQASVDAFSERYTQTIERQRERLEDFNRMVGHELRNPVNTLEITVGLLREESLRPENAERVLEIVGRSVDRIGHLLRNLEAIAQVDDDGLGPTTQEFELSALAADLADQLSDMAAARDVDLRVPPDLPKLSTDPHRVEMILLNLVANGIKYSDPATDERWVSIDARRGPEEFVLRVRDNGIGIPKDKQEAVFGRFFRAHPERDSELGNRGSGLGLALVAECARVLGGTVRLESQEGAGTQVDVVLPAEVVESEAAS